MFSLFPKLRHNLCKVLKYFFANSHTGKCAVHFCKLFKYIFLIGFIKFLKTLNIFFILNLLNKNHVEKVRYAFFHKNQMVSETIKSLKKV